MFDRKTNSNYFFNVELQKEKHFKNKCLIALIVVLIVMGYIGLGRYNYRHYSSSNNSIRAMRVYNTPKSKAIDSTQSLKSINSDASIKRKKGFINQIGYPAIKAFQKHHNYQVLPSVVIAQAIVESDWGQSGLYTQAHNVFGVKGSYYGHYVVMKTQEDNGGAHIINAKFRKYPSVEDSILDHDTLLRNIFIRRNSDMSYQDVCRLIQVHDYATDPTYAQKLIQTIKRYHLYRYDEIGLTQ